ncbi:MAG: hypothetical protein GKR97_01865 [Rhizobiaceae bacterium]|nr:hypothetical protein [Rhizobiaceae bacterium]
MSKEKSLQVKQELRLLKFMVTARKANFSGFGDQCEGRLLMVHATLPRLKIVTTEATLTGMLREDLITVSDQSCSLTQAGFSRFKRTQSLTGPAGEFQNQHRELIEENIVIAGARQKVSRNQNESPLARLRDRTGKDGQPWLNEAQFQAGELLRGDFTRAQLATSVTSNWRTPALAVHKSCGSGGRVELSDAALDARDRYNGALKYVGPDLANVLTDVCCYLKGLQMVERELNWPPRSAKLMLRTGLGLLAQFYGTNPGRSEDRP